jgi:hypothetical protein
MDGETQNRHAVAPDNTGQALSGLKTEYGLSDTAPKRQTAAHSSSLLFGAAMA